MVLIQLRVTTKNWTPSQNLLFRLISETDKYEDGQAEVAVADAHPNSRDISEMTVADAFADWD